jgi:diguanylate cyclase (GGDEF)-like protein
VPLALPPRLFACLLFAALAAYGRSAAAEPVRAGEAFHSTSLAHQVDLLEDPTGALDFEQVRDSTAFEPIGARKSNFGFSRSVFWVRVTIENTSDTARELLLRQDYPLIDYLDAWIEDGAGGWKHTATGDRRAFDTREVEHRDFVFDVPLAAHASQRAYLRFATSGAMNIGLRLYSHQALTETLSREQLAYGFYYGGFGVLVFYNLFIFLVVRDRAFFYYLLYAVSYGLYFGVHNGLSFQFLWPDSPAWANRSLIVLLALSLLFGLQFTRQFLDSATHAPRLDRVARGLQLLCVAGFAAAFAFEYAQVIVPIAMLTVLATALILALGIDGLVQGYRPARYFMLAWVLLLVGVLVYMLKTFGVLPHNAFTQNAFQAGALLEMVLLSLALASRVNELQRQTLTDPLTKLANRRFFDRQLDLAVAHMDRGSIALLVLDIDHFKQFNDRYGHAMGDKVLTTVGRVLTASTPRGATVCRYGGEEFTVILPATSTEEAQRVAESLRHAVETTRIGDVSVTISIGLACASRHTFSTSHEFFHAADSALYDAKDQGRNRVVTFTVQEAAAAAN